MKRFFICTTTLIQGFNINKKYETDENGYYDFGGGLKVNLSKNDNFKEYIPKYSNDTNYYFVKSRWAKNDTQNLPFIILEEKEDNKVVIYRLYDDNLMNSGTHSAYREQYIKGKLNSQYIYTMYFSHLEQRTPYWFLSSKGSICQRWKETEDKNVLKWRIRSDNYFESYRECREKYDSIMND